MNEFKPQILSEAITLDLNGLDKTKIFAMKEENQTEELYKYLLIAQCNSLSEILPMMFQKIDDYTELLLPNYLLREGSVIEQMISCIPEDDWKDQVQIIGWLYQYYNAEPKDEVFANLKKNIKISKENIPAATQLFTPDWIVRYMVENSLGRLWTEGHGKPENAEWKYYLEEAEQEPEVQAQLEKIRAEYAEMKPEDIKCIDPCMGSGHILVYMFDVLVQIYESYGYTAREAAGLILEKNLYGLDIDERAAQLAYFAVMMKARQYDRRIFTREIKPHIHAIEESNGITTVPMHDMGINLSKEEYVEASKQAMRLVEELQDVKEYGSLVSVTPCDWDLLRRFAVPKNSDGQLSFDIYGEIEASEKLQRLIDIGICLSQKYDVCCTNPPYMGGSGMDAKLSDYVKKSFPDSKSDLFACFIERCGKYSATNGFYSMITQHAFMFLSSYEKLRQKLHDKTTINMAHLGARAFDEIGGEVVQTTAFINFNSHIKDFKGTYSRLVDVNGEKEKEKIYLSKEKIYTANQENFSKIPGSPVAYWVSENFIRAFEKGEIIERLASVPKGLSTGSVDRFMRFWYELKYSKIDFFSNSCEDSKNRGYKWFPYAKGGSYRRWNGNLEYVVNWENDGYEVKNFVDERGKQRSRPQNTSYYFHECITYSAITSGLYSVRYLNKSIFGGGGDSIQTENKDKLFLVMAYLNSIVAQKYLNVISPTMNFEVGHIKNLPVIIDETQKNKIDTLVEENIAISKTDWDSFETSWDFKKHPFMRSVSTIKKAYEQWENECDERFNKLKANEEELNRIFIDIYGLQDELTPEVEDKDVTVRKADLTREIKSLISYAVGCMFGRYSLDVDGLAYAGGEFDSSKYTTFSADKDNIIPICDDDYFDDDITGLFVKFVKTVYGEDTLKENLKFIADALGGKGTPRAVIRNYFLNDFFADHCKIYQKRPIYWLFDSGKKNGFKALIYMHRYQPDTIARIRTDYVHEQQSRYRTSIEDIENRMDSLSSGDRIKINNRLKILKAQNEEIHIYEEKIHHLADQMISIDLDDGVKVNYAKFQEVLAKIK